MILDDLSMHRSLQVQLQALAHERVGFLFQPTYAPWLNLIEPWWKTLRSLALQGRRFEGATELIVPLIRERSIGMSITIPITGAKPIPTIPEEVIYLAP